MRGVAGDKETVERQNIIGGVFFHSHPNLRRPLLPDSIQLWYYRTRAPYPLIVGAFPHYSGDSAYVFANVVKPLKVILSFYRPQI